MRPGVQDVLDKLAHVSPQHSNLFGSKTDIAFRFGMEVMLDIVNSLLSEKAEDIVFVTNEREKICKKPKCVSFKAPSLTGDPDIQLCTHCHGCPSLAFFPFDPPSPTVCMKCRQPLGADPSLWDCGCNFCQNCGADPSLLCRCMTEGLLPYIKSVASVIAEDGKRKVEVDELHLTREASLGQNTQRRRTDDDQDGASLDRQGNCQQIATMNTELQEITKRAVATEYVAFPPASLGNQAQQYVYKGKCLGSYTIPGLRDILRMLERYKGKSSNSKQEFVELAYEAIMENEENERRRLFE
jgi:hypothetical protein